MSIPTDITSQLKRLIAFKPVTGDTKQVLKLLDYVAAELALTGLRVERGSHNGYPYLLAGSVSVARSKLLLQAHVDVVPGLDAQFELQAAEGLLYGRGVYDMLFAVAVYIVLMQELAANNTLNTLDVGIMLTSDEELGGLDGAGKLLETYFCDICFLPDSGSITHACVASKGVLMLHVTATGIAGHSSRPSVYQNPIPLLAEFVSRLEELYPNTDSQDTTCAITQFHGGDADNQVPSSATLTLDIRYAHTDTAEQITDKITEAANASDLKVTVLAESPLYLSDPTTQAYAAFEEVYEATTGTILRQLTELGSSDAGFFAAKDIPVIMVRPDGGELHGDKEWVDKESLGAFYTILRAYIMKVGQL